MKSRASEKEKFSVLSFGQFGNNSIFSTDHFLLLVMIGPQYLNCWGMTAPTVFVDRFCQLNQIVMKFADTVGIQLLNVELSACHSGIC